ncbi:MAG: hypothetical protein ACTSQO_15050 [Candidatus Helarchaeota archaeon]
MKFSSTKKISPEMGEARASFTSTELLTAIIISFTIVDAYKLEQLKIWLICFKSIVPFLKNLVIVTNR